MWNIIGTICTFVFLLLAVIFAVKAGTKKQAELEAEKIKSVIEDNTLNKLAKYVHNVLDLNNLDCGYDINNEK